MAVLHRVEGRPPRRPRRARTTTLISQAKSTKPSRISGFGASAAKAGGSSSGVAQQRLALAVIAEPRGLQHRRQAERAPPPRPARPGCPPAAQGAVGTPAPLRKLFSATRSWLIAQHRGRRPHRLQRGQQVQPLGADVLELEGDHVDRGGEGAQRGRVLVVAERDAGGDLRRPGCRARASGYGSDSRAAPPPWPTCGRAGRRRRCRSWRSAAAAPVMAPAWSAGRLGHRVGLRGAPGVQPRRPAPGRRRPGWRRPAGRR